MKSPMLAPSLLSADFGNLEKAIKQIEENNGSVVHIDVMDGQFVPEITYGQPIVRSIRKLTKLPFDVHLMVDNPEQQIESFAKAGADWIDFHLEATNHAHRLIQMIHDFGKKAGVAIKTYFCTVGIAGICRYYISDDCQSWMGWAENYSVLCKEGCGFEKYPPRKGI